MTKYVYATVDFGNEKIYQAWQLLNGSPISHLVVLQKRPDGENLVIRLENRKFANDKLVGPEESVYPITLSIKDAFLLKPA